MRIPAAPLFLVLAFALAAPAGAQIAGTPDYGDVRVPGPFLRDSRTPSPPVFGELRDIRGDIDRARESGIISGREARRLRREGRVVGALADRYARDGLTESERLEIENRTLLLRSQVYTAPNRSRSRRSGRR